MKTFEATTTINAPPATVFDYVSDFTKHGDWAGHGLQVTKDSDGPVAIGSTYSTVAKQFGTQREHSTVTELEPGRVFGWDSKGALGTVHHRFMVAAAEGGTNLTKSAEFLDRSFLAKHDGLEDLAGPPSGASCRRREDQGAPRVTLELELRRSQPRTGRRAQTAR